jgi:hypothetical protein
MPPRKASRMFRVVVVAGVSLAACGSEDKTGNTGADGGPTESSNPPGPQFDARADSPADAGASDAPADAIDEMPLIK